MMALHWWSSLLAVRPCLVDQKGKESLSFPLNQIPPLFPFLWEIVSLLWLSPNAGKKSISFPNAHFLENKYGLIVVQVRVLISFFV
ncbi:hypothetical protein RchiOBHm_Chr3g0458841 [Rosa chinensis]|uniref:Uncharacterized protein n=1 Tax=Rosa chinensis TaxID=74649 RepID=A0A2P6R7X8_ROSCH|nr:hypothetical protein RchiOBHm_Chr3g0458841 [Rosa chinensis]